jgi:hypothetical protein
MTRLPGMKTHRMNFRKTYGVESYLRIFTNEFAGPWSPRGIGAIGIFGTTSYRTSKAIEKRLMKMNWTSL